MKTNILNSFINAPDLKISSEEYPFNNFCFEEDPVDDSDFTYPKDLVLGKQAEAAFEEYLILLKRYQLLAANLQIHTSSSLSNRNEKETLGELDYIVRDLRNKKLLHIELACKFYLFDTNASSTKESKWIGPNRKDSLYDKLEKTKWKQFPLINSVETVQKLKELGIEHPTSQELCLKAFLFIPKEKEVNILPKNFRDCIVGHWIKQVDFKNEDVDALYAIPDKKEWLLPYEHTTNWLSYSEIKLEIDKQILNSKSPLIYKKTSSKTERFFVVWW